MDEEEACSAVGIADILIERGEADVGGMNADVVDVRSLKGQLISEDFGIAKAMP